MTSSIFKKAERAFYTLRTYQWIISPNAWRHLLSGAKNRKIDRPIFLLGTQGGGLTLLVRMLRRGGGLVTCAGGDRYWTAADEMQNSLGPILPADFSGARWKRPPHPVFDGPRSWSYAVGDLHDLYRKRASDATEENVSGLRKMIRVSLARHAPKNPNARFIDKSQTFTMRVGLISKALEGCDPRFVMVPREPYISVYRAAMGKAGDMEALKDRLTYEERIEICAEHYAASMRAAFEDADALGLNMHLVPFETLLTDPEGELRRICAFLDLEFKPDMIPSPDHEIPFGSRFRDRWYPLRTDVNSSYDAKLDALTIEAVNRHCGDMIERLGYARRDLPAAAA